MCIGGGGSAPAPSAQLPEAPRAPLTDAGARGTDADERRRRAAAGTGTTSTILTGPRGVTGAAQTNTKTLLGT